MTYTSKNLIFSGVEATTDIEVISLLADAAIDAGYAMPSFKDAVLSREKTDPTALNMSIPIAVPHVHTGCKKNFIAIATLKNPVNFGNMADLKNTLGVQVVFLVGLECLSVQSRVLRNLFDAVQLSDNLNCYLSDNDSVGLLESLVRNMGQNLTVE